MKGKNTRPTAEARSPRVAMQGTAKAGPLSYALVGQKNIRPMAHSGKPSMKMGTGIYPARKSK